MDIQQIRNQIRYEIAEENTSLTPELAQRRLELCNCENTAPFDLTQFPTGIWCKVLDVYDGDTCTIAACISNLICSFKIRMYGYDAPELKPRRSKLNRSQIIKNAKESRDALKSQILGKMVRLVSHGMDSFGRILGTIYLDNLDINQWMLDSKFGIPYKK